MSNITHTKPSLFFCIAMDILGYGSYMVPLFGEFTDIIWAPIASIIFFISFGRKKFGLNGAVFSFIEEIFPGLDFIPTFTIAWIVRFLRQKSEQFITVGSK